MKKLYEKNEVLFAVLWIVAYCALTIPVRGELGDASPLMTAALAVLALGAAAFVRLNHLEKKYGLDGWARDSRRFLYFLPMFILATGNLWSGFGLDYRGMGQVWATLSMALIGFVEEMLFRGFLFKARLKKDGVKVAVIVSAVTFGIGRIVNLLAGQGNWETVGQVIFAVAWGFLFTLAYYKSGSLWPCIAVHAIVDVASLYNGENLTMEWVYIGATILIALIYCPYLLRLKTPESSGASE